MSTPTRRSSRRVSSSSSRQASEADRQENEPMDTSDLARPLPQSSSPVPPSAASNAGGEGPRDILNSIHGPGSVLVSEIDLSSPLNYGTPSSLGSSTFRTPGGVRGTPIRIRSDIQSERKLRQVNVNPGSSQGGPGSSRGEGAGSETNVPMSGSNVPPSEASENAPQLVIWGTDVSVSAYKTKFRKFLEQFIEAEISPDEKTDEFDPNQPLYVQLLSQINDLE